MAQWIRTNGSIGESVRIICRENDLLTSVLERGAGFGCKKRRVTHLSGVNFVGPKKQTRRNAAKAFVKSPASGRPSFPSVWRALFCDFPSPPPARLGQSINTRRQPTALIIEDASVWGGHRCYSGGKRGCRILERNQKYISRSVVCLSRSRASTMRKECL